ncbi:shikimate kinase [Actinobacillus pleuropneumoniae]|nr:shikimate kinase [Actinobacillus pleuropneumoniae]
MAEKRNIFLIGPMGAGKSTIGRQLAQMLGMEFIDSDAVIEERAGADIDWIFDLEGETGFRKREERIINELTQTKVLYYQPAAVRCYPKKIATSCPLAVSLSTFETTVDKQFERTQRDKKRPLLQTENPRETLEALAKVRNPLYEENCGH